MWERGAGWGGVGWGGESERLWCDLLYGAVVATGFTSPL